MAAAADVASRDADGRIRLFCFAHAGGNAALFQPWALELRPEIEVIPVQLPGHGSRLTESALTDIRALAREFLEITATDDSRPTAVFGHSMGALVAFELARQMQRIGRVPLCLFASAFRAPQLPDRGQWLHALPDDELLAEVAGMNGTPSELLDDRELVRIYLPVIRADFKACETYVYEPAPPLTCSIAVLGGTRDTEVTREELLAWHLQTRGRVTLEMFEGDHFFIRSARERVVEHVRLSLGEAVSGWSKTASDGRF